MIKKTTSCDMKFLFFSVSRVSRKLQNVSTPTRH